MTFSITTPAVQEILAAAVRSDAAGMALRVAARPTPDGVDYGMGFDEAKGGDDVQDFDGLKVVVAAPSRRWLEGIVLDYVEIEPGRHDFAFLAPTADNGTARSTAPAADPGPPPGSGPGCGSGGCGGCGR